MKIRPDRLQIGDTVGLVALSGPISMEKLGEQIAFLEELGLRYKMGNTIQPYEGYLAGTDAARVADLHAMIQDPGVKAIFCVKGGYGIARILDKISYPLIEENPKIIWGFSDVTLLHTAVNEYANVVTFHGPMLRGPKGELDLLSKKMCQQLFMPIEIQYDEQISPLHTIVGGTVRGEISGGNLSRIVSTLGTKFELDMRGKIVLLEDTGESLAQIDGMLNHLRLARKLEQAAGFVIGDFNMSTSNETNEDVFKLFDQYLQPLNKPALAGFKMGHCEPNIGIPLGVEVILDANEKSLRILPGVE